MLQKFRAVLSGLSLILFFIGMPAVAVAQDYQTKFSKTPIPNWVDFQTYPQTFDDGFSDGAPRYLLSSIQHWQEPDRNDYYSRTVQKVTDLDVAENVSQLNMVFDPSYETLELHHILVTREGVTSDRLADVNIRIVSVESEAERLIYNENVKAVAILEDIRVGDIVDIAYSQNGKLDIFEGIYSGQYAFQFGVPLAKHYVKLRVPENESLKMKSFHNAPAPAETILDTGQNRYRQYIWSQNNIAPYDYDEDMPSWYIVGAQTYVTSFDSWSKAGQELANAYTPQQALTGDLAALVTRIKTENATQQDRLEAALEFVQAEIRYLAINIGDGGYIPRAPEKVLSRRFGDCKDKTLLLNTLLYHLGINAEPALVNTGTTQNIDQFLPGLRVFNHVISRISFNGETYWFDATDDHQLGSIDVMQQANYGKALIISQASPGLVDMPDMQTDEWNFEAREVYDVNTEDGSILLDVEVDYYGHYATSVLQWFKRDGQKSASRDELEGFESVYDNIEQINPVTVDLQADGYTVRLKSQYKINDAWSVIENSGRKEFDLYPHYIYDGLPDSETGTRSSPYAVYHPIAWAHNITVITNNDWHLTEDNFDIENAVFSYLRTENFNKKTYHFTSNTSYRSHKDHIAPGEFKPVMDDIRKLEEGFVTSLQFSDDVNSDGGISSRLEELLRALDE